MILCDVETTKRNKKVLTPLTFIYLNPILIPSSYKLTLRSPSTVNGPSRSRLAQFQPSQNYPLETNLLNSPSLIPSLNLNAYVFPLFSFVSSCMDVQGHEEAEDEGYSYRSWKPRSVHRTVQVAISVCGRYIFIYIHIKRRGSMRENAGSVRGRMGDC